MTGGRRASLHRSHRWCCYCAVETLLHGRQDHGDFATIEHRDPLSRGGSNRGRNIALACYSCNHAKGDMLEDEFRSMVALGMVMHLEVSAAGLVVRRVVTVSRHPPRPARPEPPGEAWHPLRLRAASLDDLPRTGTNLGDILRAAGIA